MRINKYLSLCGVTSRRGAEALIAEKRVTVNDITIDKVGVIIDEATDVVKVDGTAISPVDEKIYVVLHKPRMVMTTLRDPFKRRTVLHFLRRLRQRVYPVGRLDYDTEGVLLLTNDGDLTYRLAHPKYEVPKIYEAKVLGTFSREAAAQIEAGIKLDDGAIGHAKVNVLGFAGRFSRVRLVLTEGRKREVKQLCKKVGFPVEHLVRVEFAGINLKNLKPGEWRFLSPTELDRLKTMVELN
ncbi:MAG: pseudouridine synthase [candidate division Zixibacteria bacterium]|nr:pseudouridine synthase [candidate division Zixibacteria bacterium]